MFRGGFPPRAHRPSRCLLGFGISGPLRSGIRGRQCSHLLRLAPLRVLPPQSRRCRLRPTHRPHPRRHTQNLRVGSHPSELLRGLHGVLVTHARECEETNFWWLREVFGIIGQCPILISKFVSGNQMLATHTCNNLGHPCWTLMGTWSALRVSSEMMAAIESFLS